MADFLEKVSDFLFNSFGKKLDEVCVVLPNRRGGLFLKKHLASKFQGPVWAPEIYAIDDFTWELSGLQQTDLAEQLFIFYSVYKNAEGAKAEPFDLFCKWAPTLLADFSEADNCLADTEKLFGNLRDIRVIENWSLGQDQLTDFQKQYLHFWERIGIWYRDYKKALSDERKGYAGLAYRAVAEKITTPGTVFRWKKIVFAGFNALSPSEEKIISVLQESGRADVLWDADRYYMDQPAQEAGRFLRQWKKKYFQPAAGPKIAFDHIEDRISTETKKVSVTGVARLVSQAKAAAHFLETFDPAEMHSTSTAVVLADEMLLLPLLHALPDRAETVNITMGFPLRNTPVAELVISLFRLHENAQRFSIHSRQGELKYYHSDLIRLLCHPYVRRLLTGSGIPEKLESEISRLNIIFATQSKLQTLLKGDGGALGMFAEMLVPWTDTPTALNRLQRIIEILRSVFTAGTTGKFNIETEYLFQLNIIVKRAQTLHQKWPVATDLKSLRALITQQLISTSLPFYGEPVAGLQIMGLLETRTLDFENVILLGANENILPGARTQPTFIIYELRKAFRLPVWSDRDATAAYNFYRLLQRAKNFHILYNTDQEAFGNREKSRFITQLLHELPARNKNATVTEAVFDPGIPLASAPPPPIKIPKDTIVLQKMDELAAKGISPSLLNSYRACGLQFYFHYVAGLREPEEVEESIGADKLGTIIHRALEALFKPLTGQPLTEALLAQAKKKVEITCEEMFAKHYSLEESSTGKNLLAKKIALRYLENYFGIEMNEIKQNRFTVSEVEAKLEHTVVLPAGKSIHFAGTADRIDQLNSMVRLIDYKTGKTEPKELKIKEWKEIKENPAIGKSFQLLMYAWLYSRMKKSSVPVQSGIISFRHLANGLMNVKTPAGEILLPEVLDTFEEALLELLEELFDSSRDFVQTEELETCRICAFNGICRRD
ncbi:MAG TPA: PD-(D/E)XK nuclease family protein [Bacteroidia bacterium]|nr:PD-(D/E)XK nuclease family protein [Bacteroidia bacterium]